MSLPSPGGCHDHGCVFRGRSPRPLFVKLCDRRGQADQPPTDRMCLPETADDFGIVQHHDCDGLCWTSANMSAALNCRSALLYDPLAGCGGVPSRVFNIGPIAFGGTAAFVAPRCRQPPFADRYPALVLTGAAISAGKLQGLVVLSPKTGCDGRRPAWLPGCTAADVRTV